jgi:hypothetical protein
MTPVIVVIDSEITTTAEELVGKPLIMRAWKPSLLGRIATTAGLVTKPAATGLEF